ncbi:class I SAM-dependent methyltransferase [Microcella daejeonensis]|uniref:Class I SAM-dependent methyltransferase n=1 Tax=Microcella daejeonensis TaxID=2994971 RepID=A0A9E8MJ52_9MICO|nr:class I SAM-dependent methyltransferase [Microcella daejeonensis]WAB80533.1 class I SAM-dependent methyltransferase [Microcella daejeonensis]
MPDYDPRLVALYDDDNPDGEDHRFYRGLIDRESAAAVLDLGCGTGILTVTLAATDRRVVGVDPSERMIGYARARAGADRVEWVDGDSRDLPSGPFDAAIMTGNVAQHITGDDWSRTLDDIRARMPIGGLLAFEARNPSRRPWEDWVAAGRTVRDTRLGSVEEWYEAAEGHAGIVRITAHTVFASSGDHVVHEFDLAFRDRATLERHLTASGFAVEAVHGDWRGTPFSGEQSLMIVEARAV